MKQVVVIHGGDSFATDEAYLDYLRNYNVESIDYFKSSKGWKDSLPEALGPDYELLLPRMPNSSNAKYLEWKIWFEKLVPFLKDGVVLIGHSLGGSFLAKYLSTATFPVRIAGTFLLAPPYNLDYGNPIPEFEAPQSLELLERQGGSIFLYHSEDDPVVPIAEHDKYVHALPRATSRVFKDRSHFFGQATFPELVADIKALG